MLYKYLEHDEIYTRRLSIFELQTETVLGTKMTNQVLNKEEVLKRGYLLPGEESLLLVSWMRKANLTETPNTVHGEGVWIGFLSEEDLELYESNDAEGQEVIGILLNDSYQVKRPTYGLVARFRHNGSKRPSLFITDFINQITAITKDE